MVFVRPVVDAVYNIFTNHASLGSGIVAADRTVGPDSVSVDAAEICGNDLVEAERLIMVNVVIDHVHDDADAIVMKRFHHLLHFGHTHLTVERIGAVGAFGNIEVHGIVTPVILRLGKAFIGKTEVINRKQVNVGHAQRFDMVNTGGKTGGIDCAGFGQTQEFALVLNAGVRIHAQVAYVQLINHSIGNVLAGVGICILRPAFGVGGRKVKHHGAVTVDTGGSGVGVTGFSGDAAGSDQISIVSAVQIAGDDCDPCTADIGSHGNLRPKIVFSFCAAGIEINRYRFCSGRPKAESGLLSRPDCAQIIAGISKFCFKIRGRIVRVHDIETPFA